MKRIVLVACCGKKLDRPAPARDLYQSQLFKGARRYAESHGDAWFILSALHGLVAPDEVTEPYDRTLNGRPEFQRKAWAAVAFLTFLELVGGEDVEIEILAGRNYREFLQPMFEECGYKVTVPMAGLGIGQQLQFLSREECHV